MCVFLAASHNIWAANPIDTLEDFGFSPEMKIRIQSESKDLAKAFKMTYDDAFVVCTNYWIVKCKTKEQHGANCQQDIPKSDKDFYKWMENPTDIFNGITCRQHIIWMNELTRRNPGAFIPR